MIKVSFRQPITAYDFSVIPALSFMAKFIFCNSYSKTNSEWDLITINFDKSEHLCIDKSNYDYNIQSIEHVKPSEL